MGRPNTGKSTLVNRLVGQKVAIVTSRPQTTRNRIQGIVNRPHAQVILIDTPGLHRPKSALGRQMMGELAAALEAVDVLALLLDVGEEFGAEDREVLKRGGEFQGPRILLLNKIDRVKKSSLLPRIELLAQMREFAELIPISALTGDGVSVALEKFIEYLPSGQPYFPPDQYTDQPERFLAAEIVREKAMDASLQEVPHALAVVGDSFEETDRLIRIRCTLYVEREGQKGILIGRGGETMKQIGIAARKELEQILGIKIHLDLFVKVRHEWRNSPQVVRELDWRNQLDRLSRK